MLVFTIFTTIPDAKPLRLVPNTHGCLVMDESGHNVWCPGDLNSKA